MSTVNIGSAVPAGTNIIGQIKLVDTAGVNQATVDANNNLHVALYNAANSMGIDSSNNAHVGIWNGTNQAVVDAYGDVYTFPGLQVTTLSAWNSSTSLNTTQTIFAGSGSPAALVQLDQTTTLTAGAITFEVSYDGTNWVAAPANCVLDPTSTSYAQIAIPYTVQASTNKAFIITGNGWQGLRIRLSTAITGTGTVTPYYALLAYDPVESTIAYSPTAANFKCTATATQSGTWTAVPNAATSGGSIPYHLVSAASTNATSLKASAGQIYGFEVSNTNASARYLKFYNSASAPTVGTTTIVKTVQIPGNATVMRAYPVGLAFTTGIAYATTANLADADTTVIGAGDLSIDIDYK